MANSNNSNQLLVPGVQQALDQMKYEIANELGMSDYQHIDKGNLTSRQNGYVGGYMVKRMVEYAEQNMSNK